MSDLIDRQAAILIPVLPKEYREYQTINLDDAYELGWYDLQKCIEKMPSAQSEPKKGKWELKEDILSWEGTFDGYFCSECGKGFLNDLCCNNGADWVDVQKDFKFCPFCGADMRGEE